MTDAGGALHVSGIDNVAVAEIAAEADILLHELTPQRATLEDTFVELTGEAVEFRAEPTATEREGELR